MIIKINDERGFEQSTLYFGYLEENNSTTIEFEFPEYLEKYNKKLNFMLADGTTVCKLFDDINSNKFTFTRDLLKFNKLQMAIEFFDTNEDLIYRTSILTIRISDSIICDDDVTEDDPKIIILDELIQKVNELNTETTENEATRESNEQTRISNENTRISNENKRIEEENKRISAESTRVSNEEKRVESENLRITQEETRQSNESTRTSNEEIREGNETQRIANEEIRQENANQLSSTIEKKMNKTTEKVNLIEVSTESGAKGINGNVVENPANTFKTFNVEGINEVYVNGRNHWPNEPLVIFYDNTDALISYIDTGVNSQTCQDFKVEVPENAVTMIVNGRTEDPIEAIASAYYYRYLDFQDSFNNEIERVLKLIPSRTTQISETIDIDDSSESDLNELKAFGNSKQGSTTGAQLLEITNDDLDNGDLKVTNNNGILRIVGTPPDVNYNKQIGTFVCEESGVYCLEDNVSRTDERIRIIYRINDSNWINGNSSYLLELQAGDIVHFNLRIDSMLNYNDILKPMFNKGTTKLEWEPYTGGKDSPNYDYPQEIKYIKANKNILDETAEKVNAFPTGNVGEEIGYTNSMYTVTYKNCMKVKKDQKYKLTFNRNEPSAESVRVQYITDENDIILETFNLNIEDATNEKLEFTSNYDGYLNLVLDKNATNIRIEEADAGIRFKRINNLSNFPTESTGKTSGTNYAGITYEIKNKYTSIISGKPTATEFRVGGSYDSTQIVVPFDKSKQYKLKNSLNLGMVITLVNSSNNTFIEKNIESGETIQLNNIYDGLSSLRFKVNIETTYNNDVLQYYIYDVEEEYNLPVQQNMYALVPGQEDCFIKKDDGKWYERHYSFEGELTGEENFSIADNRYALYNINTRGFSYAVYNKNTKQLCNYFQFENNWGDKGFFVSGASIRFKKIFETVEEFKQFLKNNTVKVVYIRSSVPSEGSGTLTYLDLECTAEQTAVLNQLEQFSLSRGINHIYSDDELSPKFQLKYYQDMNILLDKINKNIADVSAQLI